MLSVSLIKSTASRGTERLVIVRTEKAPLRMLHAEAECQFRRLRFAHWIRKHDLSPIRSGNFSNVRRILTLHFIPLAAAAVQLKRREILHCELWHQREAKSVLSSSRQFTISLCSLPLSHNPVQTKPIYIARAALAP